VPESPTFGVIVSTRGFFPAELAVEGRRQVCALLERLGYGCVIAPANATPHGAVETRADAKVYAGLFSANRERIDGILVVLPNFGDEKGVVETIDLAGLGVPIMVQASDDSSKAMDLAHRRDAFCGKLSVCNNLYQRGTPFTNTTLHTCAIDSPAFAADLEFFGRVCLTVRGLRRARLGAIGQRPDPFNTVRYSEKLLQRAGISVSVVDLSEIIAAAQKRATDAVVAKRAGEMRAYGAIAASIPPEHVERSAKLALAIDEWVERNECDATAIQCWSSIQQNYGCATCLPMSMMGERGKPSACETDITGALSMLALQLASGTPAGYLDWNNNYDDDRDLCVNIHCSNYPKSFIGRPFEIGNLDILGASLGPDHCFGACKAQVAPGPMTYAKITTDDRQGRIRMYVGEGSFTDDPVKTAGGAAACRVPGLQSLMVHLCANGFEHHVAMGRGHWARVLAEACGKYLGWDVYHHQPTAC
jgi:L-fucose isomerase-like protein